MTDHRSWRYILASVRGTSHSRMGRPCQDWASAHVLRSTKTGEEVLVVAASDGAGSATRAEDGAQLACRTFTDLVTAYIEADGRVADVTQADGEQWMRHMALTIAIQAEENGLPAREFACTFLGAVLSRDHAIFLQIGDGAIVIAEHDDYRPVFWPQSGEFANSTYFVTDGAISEHLQFAARPIPVDEVALLTDGLQMLALHYATRTAHAPFFRPMFARLRMEPPGEPKDLSHALVMYLDSAAINARTDDDKTLLLATRVASESSVCAGPPVADDARALDL